jgi:serine/threonine protein kinase/Tfp pilus assembly protein PilF
MPDRLRRIEEIFNAALDLPPHDRDRYLTEACGADAALRAEVDALLAHDASGAHAAVLDRTLDPGEVLQRIESAAESVDLSVSGLRSIRSEPLSASQQLGAYRILDVIGEGGMGVVYRAEQENPRRVVALKVLKSGLASRRMMRRFEYEAQILGRLHHPGIAQVFEAGVAKDSADGPARPFFAMELVPGRPLHAYAAAHRLGIRARLALLASVCDAVEHAHQKGVIHRDLKPANILVDDQGQVKVLDFGVARVLDADEKLTRIETNAGQLIGTLPYMSPEQVAGDPDELDTRSDVYALGVNLYELLTGQLPYPVERKSIPEAVRLIQQHSPTRLSTINRKLRGEAEIIVAKALDKDKSRRYQSAAELAADIRRFLAGEPIEARRDSGWYLIRKTVARHRATVAVALSILMLTTASAISLAFLYRGQLRERALAEAARDDANAARRAEEEARLVAEQQAAEAEAAARRAEGAYTFLRDMLSSSDPRVSLNRDITVREVMDETAAGLDRGTLSTDPELEAGIRTAIAGVYHSLGSFAQAEQQLRRALTLYRESGAQDGEDAVDARSELGEVLIQLGRSDEAGTLLQSALDARRASGRGGDARAARLLNDLGVLTDNAGEYPDAMRLLEESLEVRRRVLPPNASETAVSLQNVGLCAKHLKDYAKAERCYREALRIRREVLPADHPETASSLHNLGALLHELGRFDEAEEFYAQALRMRRRVLGDDHVDVSLTLNNMAGLLFERCEFARSEPLFREVLERRRRALPPEHPLVAASTCNLGSVLARLGRFDEGERLFCEGLALRQAKLGRDHPTVTDGLQALSNILVLKGDADAAVDAALDALDRVRGRAGQGSPQETAALQTLSTAWVARGCAEDLDAAEPVLCELRERQATAYGPESWRVMSVDGLMGLRLARLGETARAEAVLVEAACALLDQPDAPPLARRATLDRLITFYDGLGAGTFAALWRSLSPGVSTPGPRGTLPADAQPDQ